MKNTFLFSAVVFSLVLFSLPTTIMAGGKDDDPLLTKVMIDQMEVRSMAGSDPLVIDAETWIGYDLNKFWIKAEVERLDGETEEAQWQFLYSRAVAPFWDIQMGWRHDAKPSPSRDWLALSMKGVAPYFFEVDASMYIGKSGQVAFVVDAEYEALITQKLILSPEVEVSAYTKTDAVQNIGSGFSSMDLGLRLRYEIRREFAPYIGLNWSKKLGETADLVKAAGGDTDDMQWVTGIRAWF